MSRQMISTKPIVAALAALALGAGPLAEAGTATVTSAEGDSMTFEYRDGGLLRLSTGDPDGYMVLRDDTLYVVAMNDGEPMVINASSMMQSYSGLIKAAAPSVTTAEVVSLDETGRAETVAGIRGDVYELTVIEDGRERTQEIVMSDDPRAVEFRDALFAMSVIGQELLNDEQRRESEDLSSRLKGLDMGVLRVGADMTVTAIDDNEVPESRFALPAEPMDVPSLGGMFSGMLGGGEQGGDQDSGGQSLGDRFSNMFGGGSADAEGEQAEEGAENPVGGALKKLFGRGGGN